MIERVLLMLESSTLYLPLIIGGYITFSLMKIPYFSIEPSFVTGAIIGSKMLIFMQGHSPYINLIAVCAASILGGCLVGTITACLTTFGKIPHLLANIITIGIAYGINLFLLQGSYLSLANLNNPLILIHSAHNPELLALAGIALCLILACYLFLKTQLGTCIKIYGNNPLFFSHYRISNSFVVSCGEIIASGLAGLSGYFIAQSSGFIDVNAGNGLTLFCLTALVLGRTCLPSLQSVQPNNLAMPITGLFAYMVLQQSIISSGFDLKYFTLVQSLIITTILVNKYRKTEHRSLSDNLGV